MNKSIETQSKTIEGAIDEALKLLGASYDEVDVDIIQEAGLFKKAKVRVNLKESITEKTISPTVVKSETVLQNSEPAKQPKYESRKPEKKDKADKKSKYEKEEKQKKDITENSIDTDELPKKFQITVKFAKKLLELLGNDGEVTFENTEKSFNINVTGNGAGQIIGKGGEVLNAIQTLISTIAIANSAGENQRVYFNVEDYKERRIETLKALAVRKAEKVKESGRFIKLEPMNARDRAIIHSALQEISGIRTYSTGKEPHRCLCIAPARKEDQ